MEKSELLEYSKADKRTLRETRVPSGTEGFCI